MARILLVTTANNQIITNLSEAGNVMIVVEEEKEVRVLWKGSAVNDKVLKRYVEGLTALKKFNILAKNPEAEILAKIKPVSLKENPMPKEKKNKKSVLVEVGTEGTRPGYVGVFEGGETPATKAPCVVSVEMSSEGAISNKPAYVKVYRDGKLIVDVEAVVEQRPGGDGGMYPVVKLKLKQ
ncbi:MAG: hypothetical protein WCW02_01030 [Candidatus Buchananbacteria bacterium]